MSGVGFEPTPPYGDQKALNKVESVFETIVEEKEEESTLTKLGNTISTLFGGGSSEPAPNVTEPVQEEEEVPPESGKEDRNESQKDEVSEEPKDEAEKTPNEERSQEKSEEAGSKADATEEKDGDKSGPSEVEKTTKPQKRSKISEDIQVELLINDITDPSADDLTSSKKKLQDLTDRDLAKQERERVLNTLEAFIFETQDKLYQEDYQQVITEEEKEKILASLRETSDWMDEEGYAATTKLLREKLSQLKNLCKDMFFRVEERRKWPDRLAALNNLLNTSSFFLRSAKLIPEDDQIFTEVELNMLEKVINETALWKNDTVAEQNQRSPKEKPVLLSKDIESKLALLDREINYLLNKAKFAKPKKVKNATSTEKGSRANSTAGDKDPPPTEDHSDEEPSQDPPPAEDSASPPDSENQSQPTEATISTEPTKKTPPDEL
ncbi:hypoxia up-regulated protein 1 [Nematolebias whitei]|uniref:hypoxia up-regulated protein 1 n=1 Tax=Nematolebias whitei TaxID=451745 RepID=UPI00189B97F3|nr:hypoxia up-regulated protein 1 [Nematolebias whitei]